VRVALYTKVLAYAEGVNGARDIQNIEQYLAINGKTH
jgi:hypothetical protein